MRRETEAFNHRRERNVVPENHSSKVFSVCWEKQICTGQNLKRTFHCQSTTKAGEEFCPVDEESVMVYFKQPAKDPFIPKNKDLWVSSKTHGSKQDYFH